MIAETPEPPYYAVIFTSLRTAGDNGYDETAQRMLELASQETGFLGVESARQTLGITVSYWTEFRFDSRPARASRTPHRTAKGSRNLV